MPKSMKQAAADAQLVRNYEAQSREVVLCPACRGAGTFDGALSGRSHWWFCRVCEGDGNCYGADAARWIEGGRLDARLW